MLTVLMGPKSRRDEQLETAKGGVQATGVPSARGGMLWDLQQPERSGSRRQTGMYQP
jgi:hypothetical protein